MFVVSRNEDLWEFEEKIMWIVVWKCEVVVWVVGKGKWFNGGEVLDRSFEGVVWFSRVRERRNI